MISGIITAILMAFFAGVTAWAYSARNRERFNEAANLPLVEPAAEGRITVPLAQRGSGQGCGSCGSCGCENGEQRS